MADLTNLGNTTLSIIDNRSWQPEIRPYLGGSQLGHTCIRYLWYSFRWAYASRITNRMHRLFNRGHREEEIFIENLQYAGVHVYAEQMEVTFAYGHGKGHIDCLCTNVREAHKAVHLGEFKTMSDKYFKQLVKEGVKKAKPEYYAQCQTYMHKLSGVDRTLFMAVNKNDDAYHFERIKYDKEYAEMLMKKAKSVILSDAPPNRIKDDPTWYICKFCDAADICHHGADINQNCRTCAFVGIEQDGYWSCGQHGIWLATDQQKLGCDYYDMGVLH